MKKIVIILVLFLSIPALGQGRGNSNMARKMEEFEKVKLIEALNLDETRSIQFFTRRRDFREKQREANTHLDSLSRKLKRLSENPSEKDKLKESVNQYIEKEKQLQLLRTAYLSDIRSILTDEEFAKFIIFEREFRKDVQQMIMKRGRRASREDND